MKIRILILGLLTAVLLSACDQLPTESDQQVALGTAVAATLAADQKTEGSTERATPSATEITTQTSPPELMVQPHISFDNYLLAYTNEGNLWVLLPDGSAKQLSTTGDVVEILLSDDRKLIVYIRQSFQPELFEVRAIHTDGSNDRQILSQEALDSFYPLDGARHFLTSQIEFIPDSHLLLFNTRATFEGPGLVKNDDLHLLDVDMGERKQVLARGQGGDFVISPDGKKLAISQADTIGIANIDGTGLRPDLVSFQPIITYSEYQYYPVLVWAPDSYGFGVLLPSADPLADNPSGKVWIIAIDGTTQSYPSINGQVFFPQSNGESLLSSDLQNVAFLRENSQNQVESLLLASVDGSNSRTYDQGDLQWIGWSPDGSKFSYRRDEIKMTLGMPGTSPKPLIEGRSLRWLTADLYIVQSGQRGDWTLKMGNLSGATKVLVQPTGDFFTYDIR